MIKHIVMWKLLEEANDRSKQENAKEFKSQLESLIPKIEAITFMEVGIGYLEADGGVYDMVLTTSHATKEDLNTYVVHPEHQKVVSFAKTIVAERRVVDYEVK